MFSGEIIALGSSNAVGVGGTCVSAGAIVDVATGVRVNVSVNGRLATGDTVVDGGAQEAIKSVVSTIRKPRFITRGGLENIVNLFSHYSSKGAQL
jgi:hypothetical protein